MNRLSSLRVKILLTAYYLFGVEYLIYADREAL